MTTPEQLQELNAQIDKAMMNFDADTYRKLVEQYNELIGGIFK